ncbi:hypothetical protein GX865_01460 [Candidatus Saccharibacteria bacterium]|jgi:hypothetical protein|nr:hypothetical protein [Candidatus Saccharibacteria bacterium]
MSDNVEKSNKVGISPIDVIGWMIGIVAVINSHRAEYAKYTLAAGVVVLALGIYSLSKANKAGAKRGNSTTVIILGLATFAISAYALSAYAYGV